MTQVALKMTLTRQVPTMHLRKQPLLLSTSQILWLMRQSLSLTCRSGKVSND